MTEAERIEKDAREWCNGSPQFIFEFRGYVGGALTEHERLQEQLKQKEEENRELVDCLKRLTYLLSPDIESYKEVMAWNNAKDLIAKDTISRLSAKLGKL